MRLMKFMVLLLLFISFGCFSLYAADEIGEDDLSVFELNLNALKDAPSPIYGIPAQTQRGVIGTLMHKMFNDSGYIFTKMILAFKEIHGNADGIVPKWYNNKFVVGSILDNNTGVTIDNDLSVNGDVIADSYATTDGSSIGGKFVDGTDVRDAVYTGRRVGIGTDSPTRPLHVIGNTLIDGNLYLSGGTINGDTITNGTIDGSEIENNSLTSADIADDLVLASLSIESNHLPLNNEGVVNPSKGMLKVLNTNSGSSDAHSTLLLATSTEYGGDPFVSFNVAEGGNGSAWSIGLDNSDNDKFKIANKWNGFLDAAKTFFTIKKNGNVGIGTDNPAYTLDVNGKIRMQSGTTSEDGDRIVVTKGYLDDMIETSLVEGLSNANFNIRMMDLDSNEKFNPKCSYKWTTEDGYNQYASFSSTLTTEDFLWFREAGYDSNQVSATNKRVISGNNDGSVSAIYELCPLATSTTLAGGPVYLGSENEVRTSFQSGSDWNRINYPDSIPETAKVVKLRSRLAIEDNESVAVYVKAQGLPEMLLQEIGAFNSSDSTDSTSYFDIPYASNRRFHLKWITSNPGEIYSGATYVDIVGYE